MKFAALLLIVLAFTLACQTTSGSLYQLIEPSATPKLTEIKSPQIRNLLESANGQLEITKNYSPDYFVIPYPNGDVPAETGACTDVVIRAFRTAGVDLQKEVHEDMAQNFSVYPQKWNLPKPDTNIDHRRVLNLQTFFTRKGKSLAITQKTEDYLPGDIVAWDLDGKGMTHIGIVSNVYNKSTKTYSIIHNIGGGAAREDRLFEWKITGHYRYF
jgi:uncharacterized protein YijF (DUF1287 family)